MSTHSSAGSLETSMHNNSLEIPRRSPFDVLYWFDSLDTESTHLLVSNNTQDSRRENSSTALTGLDIEALNNNLFLRCINYILIVGD